MNPTYRIEIEKAALKFILKQPPEQQKRLMREIQKLPYNRDIVPYKGVENAFRLRVGDYRVIYLKHDAVLTIVVIRVGNRGDVYK